MNFFNKIMAFLDADMATPTMYGWFHIMFFAFTIIACIFLAIKYKNATEKQNRTILLTLSCICLVLEVYKQLNFSYNGGNWTYQWYAFPFQFCSTPMYIAFIASFLKESKFREYLYAFLGLYSLFAGLCVMLYPNTVFISTIGINIQTMVHHGIQIVFGVYMLASGRCKFEHKSALKGGAVFAGLSLFAVILNIIHHFANLPGDFNMFYISPFLPCSLPLLSMIYPLVPYPVFLLIYIVGFIFGAWVILMISWGIKKLANLIKNKLNKKTEANK